nr:hypothetical protein [uncultured Carboxylicivirga sp.]
MSKITTLLLLMVSMNLFSQEQFFVGKDSELLINKKVVLKEGKSFYSGFYKDSKIKKLLYKDGVGNNPDKLKGIEFTVVKTMNNPNTYCLGKDLVLVLVSEKTRVIYYAYDPKHADLFELNVIGGITIPEGFLCSRIEIEEDKFSSKITARTPRQYEYSLVKVQENGKSNIYLKLQSYGTTLNINKKGLKVLFSDGTVLTKPEAKIDYKTESGTKGWTYSCFVSLNEDDIKLLISKTITDYSLYVYEKKMKASNASELKEYLKCMAK